jgi:hypothetical protein
VGQTFIGAEFLGSTIEERLRMCRRFAEEARLLAVDTANPKTQRDYRNLQSQWEELAAELEKSLDRKAAST